MKKISILAGALAAGIGLCSTKGASAAKAPSRRAPGFEQIETVVVIYAENRSFDHLYGFFPGANGLSNAAKEQTIQRDHDGSVLSHLTVWDNHGKPDPRFPRLPNAPFQIDAAPVSMGADQ